MIKNKRQKKNKKISKLGAKLTPIILLVLFALLISGIGETAAYYSDTETSNNNTFIGALLDFFLTENEFDSFIGKEALGEYSVASVIIQTPGSLDIQYTVTAEKTSGDDDFCDGLLLEITKNGIEVHDADMFSFSEATSTIFGTWEFEYDLPSSVTTVGHGDECNFDFVYSGWRADSTPEASGFDDEERLSFSLTAKMIVMNELLPNPTGSDSQSGLLGEWVELYNNGDTDIDIDGWSISELADPSGTATENFYTIVASAPSVGEVRTFSGSTVVPTGGFLVILFEAQRLNNDGDTVTLYDSSLSQMDQHRYVAGEAPEGKSIARIPDGIGIWVDPIPTPGFKNINDSEDQCLLNQCVEINIASANFEEEVDGDESVSIDIEQEEDLLEPIYSENIVSDIDKEEVIKTDIVVEEPVVENITPELENINDSENQCLINQCVVIDVEQEEDLLEPIYSENIVSDIDKEEVIKTDIVVEEIVEEEPIVEESTEETVEKPVVEEELPTITE